MIKSVFVNHPIEIYLLAHREALKNAMAKGFEELCKDNVYGYEEQEKHRIYHEGAINALENIKKSMKIRGEVNG